MRRLSYGLLLLSSILNGCEDEPDLEESACTPVDYDGYTYAVTEIDDRCWFAENLRTERYRDGSPVATDLSDSQWSSTTEGAVTVFGSGSSGCVAGSAPFDACNNDTLALKYYGRLYNWYAVADDRGLCPSGWHVPTAEEWHSMIKRRGRLMFIASRGWGVGGNGKDWLGFAAMPGGFRVKTGEFFEAGFEGNWWTPSLNSPVARSLLGGLAPDPDQARAVAAVISPGYDDVRLYMTRAANGYSVRCIEDQE